MKKSCFRLILSHYFRNFGAIFCGRSVLFYTFIFDALSSINKLKRLVSVVDVIVSYHRGIISNTTSLIDAHEKGILELKKNVLLLLREVPRFLEEIVARMMQNNKIPDSLVSYVLIKASLQAYIADLEREKLVQIRVTDGVARVYSMNRNND